MSISTLDDESELQIKTAGKWYKHRLEAVTGGENVTVLWDFAVCTDRTIKANKPDVVLRKIRTIKFDY